MHSRFSQKIVTGIIAVMMALINLSVTFLPEVTFKQNNSTEVKYTFKPLPFSLNTVDPCSTLIQNLKDAEAEAIEYCDRNKNSYPMPIPPDIDETCTVTEEQRNAEHIWDSTVLEPEGNYIRGIIGCIKQCMMNCRPDTFSNRLASDAMSKLMKRLGEKQRKLQNLYGHDRNKIAPVVRTCIHIQKQLTLLGAEESSALAEIGIMIENLMEQSIKRITIEHDYRCNFLQLVKILKQGTLLGSDKYSLGELAEIYWKSQLFKMEIDIEARQHMVSDLYTGLDYNIHGESLVFLNPDYFLDGAFKIKWENQKIDYQYLKRVIRAGKNADVSCLSTDRYDEKFVFEFLPSCERRDSGQYETAFEFKKFTPTYESEFVKCIGDQGECSTEPDQTSATMPDGTVMRMEKYANGDVRYYNAINPIENLIWAALKDSLQASQKRAVNNLQSDRSKFTPPTNMRDTAAYNKWMNDIMKSQQEVQSATGVRFLPELNNRNAEAVNFEFKTPVHLQQQEDAVMNVTIKIKLTHKPNDKLLIHDINRNFNRR